MQEGRQSVRIPVSKSGPSPAISDGPLTEPLVPIRLDINVEGKVIQETFTWNSLENDITPAKFAACLAADLGLSEASRDAIAASIHEQINAFVPPKRRRVDTGESRQVVRLDMRIGRVLIRDQFEWDLNATQNCPESFAGQLCVELGLGSKYVPAVAHAIREQLIELAEFEEKRPKRPALDVSSVVRSADEASEWEPVVECLSLEEQERLERKEKREARLMRRNRGKADVYGKPVSRIRYVDPQATRRRTPSVQHSLDDSSSDPDNGRNSRRPSDNRRRKR